MAKGNRLFLTNDKFTAQPFTREYTGGTVGNVTSAPTSQAIFVKNAGNISAINLSVGTNGVDVTNPLSITVVVTNTRTAAAVALTAPVIAKAAGTGAQNTLAAATGITLTALDPANVAVKAGDVLKAVYTLTRTASPGTEIADLAFSLSITETQDFDPVQP